jgi:FkbM family methyltransferase
VNMALARAGNLLYRWAPELYRPFYFMYKARSDALERAWMRSNIKEGMTVIDLGANIGTSALFMSDLVGPSGAVYAFEPDPRNFSMLLRATRDKENVQPRRAAVGATPGTTHLYLSPDLNVDHHSYDDGSGRQGIPVTMCRLDDVLVDCATVDFIKSDIQGFETFALRGATDVLVRNRNIKLLLEFWPWGLRRAGSSGDELLTLLSDLEFSVTPIAQQSLPLDPEENKHWYTNIVAMRTSP